MRHGALFNGIGGFQLAAHWMGWQNVWHCEIDKFCNKVVKQHFPESICYEDIKQFDAREWKGKIDIISGGFPCQPFSQAGKRKGTSDDRYLWPEMLRIIGEVQPRFIVGENVGGLVNWGRGMVFEQVQADLEAAGYESAAFILPACGKNAPHRRDRIWFVAHAIHSGHSAGRNSEREEDKISGIGRETMDTREFNRTSLSSTAPNTCSIGLERKTENGELGRRGFMFSGTAGRNQWCDFPTQSPVCGRNDGVSNRVDRIKALGNAIVPQVAYEIFKAIEQCQL